MIQSFTADNANELMSMTRQNGLLKSIMFGCVLLILAMMPGGTGCDVQSGRFVVTSEESKALSSPVGRIDVVDGYETKPAHETGNINEEHLLYILIITSAIQEHGSSSSSDLSNYVTTLRYAWSTDRGAIRASITWNRQMGTITIGKREFVREGGNVFVVRVDANGETSGQQLASLGPHVRYQDVLSYIQRQLPNDSLITSVKL